MSSSTTLPRDPVHRTPAPGNSSTVRNTRWQHFKASATTAAWIGPIGPIPPRRPAGPPSFLSGRTQTARCSQSSTSRQNAGTPLYAI